MKPRVAILYSGQTRANSLSTKSTCDTVILDSTLIYFLNDYFKSRYDYDVFFSVDDIDIEKSKTFFGEHLKNIHITETDWFMEPIENKIFPFSNYYNKYITLNFQNCISYEQHLYQYYRMYCCYLLADDYEKKIRLNMIFLFEFDQTVALCKI